MGNSTFESQNVASINDCDELVIPRANFCIDSMHNTLARYECGIECLEKNFFFLNRGRGLRKSCGWSP